MRALRFHEFGGPRPAARRGRARPAAGPRRGQSCACRVRPQPPRRRHPRGRLRFPVPLPLTPGFEVVGRVQPSARRHGGGAPGDRALRSSGRLLRALPLLPHGPRAPLQRPAFISSRSPAACRSTSAARATSCCRCPTRIDDVRRRRLHGRVRHVVPHALHAGRPAGGERVLINSVGAGIASAAVQLARRAGASVIGTSSSPREAGAGARAGPRPRHRLHHDRRRRGGPAADGRRGRRAGLRARGRRALRRGPRLDRQGRSRRDLRRARRRGRGLSTSSRSSAARRPDRVVLLHPRVRSPRASELAARGRCGRSSTRRSGSRRPAAYELMEARAHVGKIVITP